VRILRLDLSAFGPFTGKSIDLGEGPEGIHIIYGSNEAGKSSALRALKCLLYGIPARSQDNFIHDHKALRIGGLISDSLGSELYFIRRKGNRDTILDSSGAPIKEAVLERYLKGVTRELFEMLFGIDHPALVTGGQNILAGKGEAGGSLFAAGTGGANLTDVLSEMEAKTDALFKPRAQNPLINKAVARYQDIKRQVSDASVSSSDWTEKERSFKKALSERDEVQGLIENRSGEQNRLRRIRELIPKASLRRELAAKIEEFGRVVILPEDFTGRRHEAESALAAAREGKRRAKLDLERLISEKAGIRLPERLLERTEAIKEIHQRLGQHKKAISDLGKLEGSYAQNMADIEVLLSELKPGLGMEEVKSGRPRATVKARIQGLGNTYQALSTTLERAEKDIREAGDKIGRLKEDLALLDAPRDPSRLKKAVLRVNKKGDLLSALKDAEKGLRAEEKSVNALLGRLNPWSGTLEELARLPVPSIETINLFAAEFSEIKMETENRRGLLKKAEAELKAFRQKIRAVEMVGLVPTEKELDERRERRAAGWELVKRAWLEGQYVGEEAKHYDPERNLADAYERAVLEADEIADRLRREAARVADYASLLSQAARIEEEIEQIKGEMRGLDEDNLCIQARWKGIWAPCSIDPLTPSEMRDWIGRYDKALQREERLSELKAELQSIREQTEINRSELRGCLATLGEVVPEGESLDKLLDRCEAVLDRIGECSRRRTELDSRISSLNETLADALRSKEETKERLSAWKVQWSEALREVGLPEGTGPEVALLLIAKLDELFKKRDDCDSLEKRISGIKRDAEVFASDIKEIVTHAAPELIKLGPEHAALSLYSELSKALQAETSYRSIEKEIVRKTAEKEEAEKDMAVAAERLAGLCRQAECRDPEELEGLERRSSEFKKLKETLASLELQITELGGGASLAETIREVESYNTDSVEAGLEKLEAELSDLKSRQRDLGEKVGALRNELSRTDGSAAAFRASEEGQQVLAEIRNLTEDYIVLRLSSLVLRKAIETYRTRNQGPLVTRTGEFFTRLTLGSFSGLKTDYSESDEPILYGLRPGGSLVDVTGMSDGTVDQLYLALRMATLERYLENNEPMPFIVDDILIRFDDDRSKAALEILSDLSLKTQVLFFTHHTRMLDLAQKINGGRKIFIKRLN